MMEVEERNYFKWPEVPCGIGIFDNLAQDCMIFLHSKNFLGWLQQLRSAQTGGGAAPIMQNSESPGKEGWAQAAPYGPSVFKTPPFPEAEQHSPG